jgi:hypothetical protein
MDQNVWRNEKTWFRPGTNFVATLPTLIPVDVRIPVMSIARSG